MSSIGDLNIRIDAVINPLLKSLNKAERSLRATGERMSRIGGDLAMNVSLPLAAIGAASIKAAGNMEQMKNGLASMMGGAEAASAELSKLQEIAKLPGINLNQAIAGSLRLQAVGLSADQARKSMTSFSNALTLAGGNSEDLAGVTLALTQIVSKGKVFAEEINQIAERVPQVRKAMMNIWGTADTEALQKMGISTEDFIAKVTDELAKLPKATGGINNAIDNTGQAITMFLANLGEDINKTFDVTGIVTAFADKLAYAAEWFKQLDAGTKKTILSIGAFAIVLGPAIKLLGLFQLTMAAGYGALGNFWKGLVIVKNKAVEAVVALNAMKTAQLAVTLGLAGIAIGAAVLAYSALTKGVNAATERMETFAEVERQAADSAFKETFELERLKKVLNDETSTREDKIRAVNEINKLYPGLIANYDSEKTAIGKVNEKIEQKIALLLAEAKAQAYVQKIRELDAENDAIKDTLEARSAAADTFIGKAKTIAKVLTPLSTLMGTTEYIAGDSTFDLKARQKEIALQIEKFGELATAAFKAKQNIEGALGGGDPPKDPANIPTGDATAKTAKDDTKRAPLSFEDTGRDNAGTQQLLRTIKLLKEIEVATGGVTSKVNEQTNAEIRRLGALEGLTDAEIEHKIRLNDLTAAKEKTLLADKGIAEQTPISIEAMEKQMKAVEKLKTAYQGAATFQEAALNSMQQIGGIIMDTMTQTGKSFKDMALEATGAILKVVKALLMQAVAQQIVNAMISSGGNPFVALAIGAIAGAGVGILFNTLASALGVPALAEGGLAYGPQLAMVGDNKNASSDPEVIAPLSKLQGMLGGTGGNVQIAGAFTGSEMRLLNEREARNRGRIRGF